MIIVEIEYQGSELVVEKDNDVYHLSIGGEVKHPYKDAEGIMRALAHYLHGTDYQLQKIKKVT